MFSNRLSFSATKELMASICLTFCSPKTIFGSELTKSFRSRISLLPLIFISATPLLVEKENRIGRLSSSWFVRHSSFPNASFQSTGILPRISYTNSFFKGKPSVDPMAYRMKTEGGAGHGHRREPEIQTRWGFKERGVSVSGEADGDSARTRNTSAKYFQGSTPRILHVHTRL